MALYNSLSDTPVTPVTGMSKDKDLAKELVPSDYHNYLVLCLEKEARILPPSRYIDHAMPLVKEAKPSFGHIYSMLDSELKEVRK